LANTDRFGLSAAVETMRIVEELVEIWPNEVCDKYNTQRAQEKDNGILTPATISRAQELSYGTFLSSK